VIFEPCDVTSWSSQYRLFERAISEFGRLDIVVANAGVVETVNFFAEEIDPESGKLREPNYTVLDINLKGLLASMFTASINFSPQPD
jgi:NAD(P)-dependent dehydrogenase (short-subunit alcohol dehydrogenase family)